MKLKVICIVWVFALSICLSSLSVKAQEPLPEAILSQTIQAENDYRSQFDLYRAAYSEYTRTKAIWTSTKSLQAEQEAITAGKAAAIKRDDVMIAYTRWLRLQILQFLSTYSKGENITGRLLTQTQWYELHKTKVAGVTTISGFDQVMAEYSNPPVVNERESLYAVAQLELKLANLAFFQHQARALYDPVLKILETKRNIPAVEQGFVRINQLSDLVNKDLVEISVIGDKVVVKDFNQRSFHRVVNERLTTLQTNQISLLNYIIELESRYAQ